MHASDGQSGGPALRVGCAGWTLPGASSAAFAGEGSHLERYARTFPAVEINSSFYRPHQAKTYARWAASVPDGFRFSVKMPKAISHELRLRGADAALGRFLDEVAALGQTLGCLLLQLPPSLTFDPAVATPFFASLRDRTGICVACEPRHATWFSEDARRVMRQAGIGCVLADPSPAPGVLPLGDPGLLYLRLHGTPRLYYSAYDRPFLHALAAHLVGMPTGMDVWCVFDNTAHGHAVPDALALLERLRALGTASDAV